MSYRLIVTFFILFGLLQSCKSKAKKKELPMDRQIMINILADVEVAEEVAKYYNKNADSIMSLYMDSIYKIHQIDSNAYNNMMEFLKSNTKVHYELEQDVHTKLKDMQEEFSTQDTMVKNR